MLKWRAGDPAKKESAFDVFELTEGRWQWIGTMRTAEHARRAADAVNHGYMLTIGREPPLRQAEQWSNCPCGSGPERCPRPDGRLLCDGPVQEAAAHTPAIDEVNPMLGAVRSMFHGPTDARDMLRPEAPDA